MNKVSTAAWRRRRGCGSSPSVASGERLRARRQLLADAALLLVTSIWGATFVMVKDAVSAFPVFSFMALRFTPGRARARAARRSGRQRRIARPAPEDPRTASAESAPSSDPAPAPLLIGAALFAGYAFQTAGLKLTTPAKAGFITGLSVVDRARCLGAAAAPAATAQCVDRRRPGDRSAGAPLAHRGPATSKPATCWCWAAPSPIAAPHPPARPLRAAATTPSCSRWAR